MRKVLFLMFLLFLIGLGAAGVKAQVRIGGNAAPNASAVLDLNADDTNSGTKGLALPRVALTSNQMLLPGVTANLTGMLVYNTSTTGVGVNTIGIYFWNGATWVKASLPTAYASDSGKVLVTDGISSSWQFPTYRLRQDAPAGSILGTPVPVSLTKIAEFSVTLPNPVHWFDSFVIPVPGLLSIDFCDLVSFAGQWNVMNQTGAIYVQSLGHVNVPVTIALRCYRPSA